MRDASYTKSINALEQIVARGGRPLVICPEGDAPTVQGGSSGFDCIEVPQSADCLQCVLSIVPLQLLSYHIACAKGLDVDCPRNLAKSVTVE
jgi:glucosamine--fructose-6-phosphate aminotransferase (isomerizing)